MGADPALLTPADSAPWLADWLAWLDTALHREVLRLRTRYQLSADELHGLYISDAQVDALLRGTAIRPERDGHIRGLLAGLHEPPTPLNHVAAEFGLDLAQTLAVGLALAPEADVKYRSVFAYLNDDISRPVPSIDLCLRLAHGGDRLLDTGAPVFRDGLLEVIRHPSAPHWRAAGLVLADPVRAFLLGVDTPPPPDPAARGGEYGDLGRAIRGGRLRLVVVEAPVEADARAAARAVAAAAGRAVVDIAEPADLPYALLRARLHRAGVALTWPDPSDDRALRTVLAAPVVALVTAPHGAEWRRHLDGVDHAVLTVRAPGPKRRAELWRAQLRAQRVNVDPDELTAVADLFALGPAQIASGAAAAGRDGALPLAEHAREQCRARLPMPVQPLELCHQWSDLVLPDATMRRLRELAGAIRHRGQVFDGWGFRRPAGGTAGIRAMFSGASGTGKTMSAAVVAADLGLPLCRVDLSAVVSKYIGETEKNLEEMFRAAEASSALLMFDEADALFGKRSEVSDAHDRYANIEVAYLLQRIETFEGALVLATNLVANLDEAFARRIQVAVEFPLPDAAARELLWRRALPAEAPVRDDIDVGHLARMFPLSGGEIRNAAVGAAFLASYEHVPIGMEQLIRAIARHRLRQGKLPTAAEFQDYLHIARAEGC